MNEATCQSIELRERASDLVRTFVNILKSCGLSPDDIIKITRQAANEIGGNADVLSVGGSVENHLVCTDVVFAWRQEPRFLDEDGVPKRLEKAGQADSFDELVRSAAPGHHSAAVLDYLVGLDVVRLLPGDRCELLAESVLACSGIGGGRVAGEVVLLHLLGFLGSVEYNLRIKTDNVTGKFERACYSRIPANLAPVFEKLVETRGQNFVDSVDEWLVRHRVTHSDLSASVLAGAGAYAFARAAKIAGSVD